MKHDGTKGRAKMNGLNNVGEPKLPADHQGEAPHAHLPGGRHGDVPERPLGKKWAKVGSSFAVSAYYWK